MSGGARGRNVLRKTFGGKLMPRFAEWSPALETALAEPFPREFVQQKKKGGSSIDFVAWHHYARRLNDLVGGGWSVGELTMRDVGGKLLIALPLTILGSTRVNVGTEDEDKDDFGDAATNAWAQAFKRSCALFGLGLGMYDKSGIAQKHRQAEVHRAALEWIRQTAERCDDDVEMEVKGGASRPVKDVVRESWTTVERDAGAAMRLVRALEVATGQAFNP